MGTLGPVNPLFFAAICPQTPNKVGYDVDEEFHCHPSSFERFVVMLEARFAVDCPMISARIASNTDIHIQTFLKRGALAMFSAFTVAVIAMIAEDLFKRSESA